MASDDLEARQLKCLVQCMADFLLQHNKVRYLEGLMTLQDPQALSDFRSAVTSEDQLAYKAMLHQALVDVRVLASGDLRTPDAEWAVNSLTQVKSDVANFPVTPELMRFMDLLQRVDDVYSEHDVQSLKDACGELEQWLLATLAAFSWPALQCWSDLLKLFGPPPTAAAATAVPPAPAHTPAAAVTPASSDAAAAVVPAAPASAPAAAVVVPSIPAGAVAGNAPLPPPPPPGVTANVQNGRPRARRSAPPTTDGSHHAAPLLTTDPAQGPRGTKRRAWTVDEDRLLRAAVKRHGVGKWAKICKASSVLAQRGQVALKDRWRVLTS
jgi:hypothetical protein